MESREYSGYWWIEDQPEFQLPGRINYEPSEGIELHLINDFADSLVSSNNSIQSFDKILGYNENGEMITLLDCPRDSSSIQNGVQTATYKPQYLIEGAAFHGVNPALDNMGVAFHGIDKWASLTNPRPSDEFLQNASSNPDQVSIIAEFPDALSAWRDDIQIQIGINPQVNFEMFESGDIQINHNFRIKPRYPQKPFHDYIEHINKLNNFIALGLGHPTDPKWVNGQIHTMTGHPQEVNIFYKVPGTIHDDVSVHPHRMPFKPADIATNFEEVINYWYDRSEEIGDIYSLYFSTVFQESMFPENKFLSLCHGLESYHRNRFQNTFMDPNDYDDVYDDLIEILKGQPSSVYSSLGGSEPNLRKKHDIPGPFVQSLEDGTIKHANKKSLRKRIKEIVSSIQSILDGLPFSIVGKHKKVADTRNYFAHRTAELKKKAAHGAERIKLIWGLQQMIEACLLLEIGIHPNLIQDRLVSRYQNRWVG